MLRVKIENCFCRNPPVFANNNLKLHYFCHNIECFKVIVQKKLSAYFLWTPCGMLKVMNITYIYFEKGSIVVYVARWRASSHG